MTLLEKINRCPPAVCRLLARTRSRNTQRVLSNRELAQRSGLHHCTIIKLSRMLKWDGVTHRTYDRFTAACGVDPLKLAKALRPFKYTRLTYWVNGSASQQRMIQRILNDIKGSRATASAGSSNGHAVSATSEAGAAAFTSPEPQLKLVTTSEHQAAA